MLLDAIFFIPTLFTYCLILLLIIILCFIVVYISHKIYISIYDNLPLGGSTTGIGGIQMLSGQLRSRTQSEQFGIQSSNRTIWIHNRSQIYQSTTVRFLLSLEPCYLACIEFDVIPLSDQRAISLRCDCVCDCMPSRSVSSITKYHIIKYYDHLNKIPHRTAGQNCMELEMSNNMRHMIDDVITDAMGIRFVRSSDGFQIRSRRESEATRRFSSLRPNPAQANAPQWNALQPQPQPPPQPQPQCSRSQQVPPKQE
ncbi:uncharacterized protein LOC115632996 [Scaptodrosophila lebanonensis]|uniref:Uncharacterized protein LOC115632996 n=1 Tax=Drosophila lebanonensis TaxID=7225 RepID=A0A6J2UCI1_DROLE|nr:uncharacterized protein LOC115632996 [Scaptodrosophila lebanonensis]